MEALGQLTGGVAHDFNNLLMVVSGHAQSLMRRLADEKDRRSLEAILAAASRGEALTRQLLTFARRQPLNPRTVSVAQTRRRLPRRAGELGARQRQAEHRRSARRLADRDRHRRIRAGAGQPRRQRARRHARGRHRRPTGGNLDAQGPGDARAACRRFRRAHGHRQRRRHSVRHPAAGLRAVLHHQDARQGHRAWPVAGLRLCPPIRRRGHGRRANSAKAPRSRSTCRAATRRSSMARPASRPRKRAATAKPSWWSRTIPT